jgi:photosystem II stability/assembly factor-like uncharacterized protein
MKKLFVVILLIFTLSVTGWCQHYYYWTPVNSPVANNLNSIIWNYSTGIAVGNDGKCIVSTNSGNNWFLSNTGNSANLNSIIVYPKTFAVGSSGTIIKSSDYGLNWESIVSPTTNTIYSIAYYISLYYKIICGEGGKIFTTSNEGVSWSEISSGTTNTLRNVNVKSSVTTSKAYICGDNGTFLKILFTFPPIPPLTTVLSYNTDFPNNFYSVSPVGDTNNIFLVGSGGIILKSTNAGLNWTQQQSGTNNNLKFINAVAQNDIWVGGDNGTMLHTTNGGQNWYLQSVNSNTNINSMVFISEVKACAVGSGGTILSCDFPNPATDTTNKRVKLEGNNISSYFQTTGIYNQNTTTGNSPGFEWPKGSSKTACFTSGLSIAASVDGELREAMCTYHGEYSPGTMKNGIPEFPVILNRIYSVKQGDNCFNSIDWANWGSIVPYGAPYIDVNHNGQYDACIDIPGVKNASQTIFMALTDGFPESHTSAEGFGGGTLPLNADLKITAWCYNDSILNDVQFINFNVINRGTSAWDNTYFALAGDFDLGDQSDDYYATDSVRNMWIGYNGDNDDRVYGANPPAMGMRILRFPVNNSISPKDTIRVSAGNFMTCISCNPPACETDPNGQPQGAYNFMKGYKKDLSPWMNPIFTPPAPTKFTYSGEPEPNTGWTELKGKVDNCGGPIGPIIEMNMSGDRRYILSLGKENFTMNPGDSQNVLVAQMITRGSSNLNSVTKLKALSDTINRIFNNGLNILYTISGNVKYSDNNQAVANGYVKAFHLDNFTGNVIILDSANIQSDGSYILHNVPQGDSYIGAVPNSTQTVDYALTYYPSSTYWQNATILRPLSNLNDIDIRVMRLNSVSTSNSVSGKVLANATPITSLKDVNIYAMSGDNFVGFAISDLSGVYHLNSLPTGNIKVFVNRLGYISDSLFVNIPQNGNIDSVNFYLNRVSVGIHQISSNVPNEFKLFQNYPNPFNPTTNIKYQISNSSFVSLKVYDILGKEIITLVNEKQIPGFYEVSFNANSLASGIYFYRLSAGNFVQTKRMILLK